MSGENNEQYTLAHVQPHSAAIGPDKRKAADVQVDAGIAGGAAGISMTQKATA